MVDDTGRTAEAARTRLMKKNASIHDFLEKYHARAAGDLPKYAQLQQALAAAIDEGLWKPGEQLPGESQLTRMTPFSLGTVQKAVNRLVQDGRVVRLHGRGTFVAARKKPVEEPLIYVHFLDDDGTRYLPIYPKLVRSRVAGAGPWSSILNAAGGILCIEREFSVNDEFSLYSKFYLDTGRFPGFARKSPAQLGGNLKRMLAKEFGVRVLSYSQELMLKKLPPEICHVLKVKRGTVGLTFAIVAYAKGEDPVYYQEIFIHPNSRRLRLPGIVQTGY